MLLPLLLSGCGSVFVKPSTAPNVPERQIPPLSKAARQSTPSEPHLQRVRRNIEQWEQMLLSVTPPVDGAKGSTTP